MIFSRQKHVTLKELLPLYFDHLDAAGVTAGTRKGKEIWLGAFDKFYGDNSLLGVDYQLIDSYATHLRTTGRGGKRKASTTRTYLHMLRAFFSWAYRYGHLSRDPMAGYRLPKLPVLKRQAYDPFELRDKLLSVCPSQRDRLLIELLFRTAARVAAAAGAKYADIDWANGTLCLAEKGGKIEYKPLSDDFMSVLKAFQGQCPFIIWNQKNPAEGVSGQYISQRLRQLADAAGLPDVSAHSFRHAVSTFICETAGIHAAAGLLGDTVQMVEKRYVSSGIKYKRQIASLLDGRQEAADEVGVLQDQVARQNQLIGQLMDEIRLSRAGNPQKPGLRRIG